LAGKGSAGPPPLTDFTQVIFAHVIGKLASTVSICIDTVGGFATGPIAGQSTPTQKAAAPLWDELLELSAPGDELDDDELDENPSDDDDDDIPLDDDDDELLELIP
jgi:hypothetical protein